MRQTWWRRIESLIVSTHIRSTIYYNFLPRLGTLLAVKLYIPFMFLNALWSKNLEAHHARMVENRKVRHNFPALPFIKKVITAPAVYTDVIFISYIY